MVMVICSEGLFFIRMLNLLRIWTYRLLLLEVQNILNYFGNLLHMVVLTNAGLEIFVRNIVTIWATKIWMRDLWKFDMSYSFVGSFELVVVAVLYSFLYVLCLVTWWPLYIKDYTEKKNLSLSMFLYRKKIKIF